MIKKAYIIFSKIPAAGFSKTRLIPVLGARVAANVQLQMLKRLLQQALRLKSVDVFFAYRARDGDNPRDFLQYLPKTIKPFSQIDSDLGKAMAQAMITVQQKGYQQVVLTGSDLPKLTTEIIEQAFRALNGHDTVLGPTFCLFIDAAWFIGNSRSLGAAGRKPFKVDQRKFKSDEKKQEAANQPLTTADKKRILAIILVTMFSVVFWMVWYLAYMPTYYYFGWGDGASFLNRANWMIGGFHVPTSYFDSLNALTCIVLGPILGKLWTKMANRPKGDMSMFKKTALGMIFVGLSYVVMVLGDKLGNGHASILWIVIVSILMSVGEMVFSPLGNSFITKLAPAKLMGVLLGFWPIAVFFATLIYPKVYTLLKTDVPSQFQMGYGILAVIVIGLGLILYFSSKYLDALEKD